jgi:hypothetical protein
LKELGGLVVEIGSIEVELLGASVEDFVNDFTGVDQGWIIADGLDRGIDSTSLELNPGICHATLGLENGDSVCEAGISGVGIAIHDNGISDGPDVDIIGNLLDVRGASRYVGCFSTIYRPSEKCLKIGKGV